MKREIRYAVFTDIGGRPVNEDSVGAFRKDGAELFVLCDGLGGHGMGDAASSLVVDVFEDMFRQTEKLPGFLDRAFTAGQEILMTEQRMQRAEKKMKTTVTALAVDDRKAYIGHVGDSRVYVFRNQQVLTRTLDHSIPQMLALSGEIKEEEIRHHPDRSLLLRVMGVQWEEPMYELMKPLPMRKCEAFLLCSDGFWELIEEEEMCRLLRQSASPGEWLERMAVVIRHNGEGKNMDNFSAIAVWCG